ncbi:NADP-dependent oxidoreductase [Cupriavidus sp. IDO]|uniref:NADP-dependent oxidoreductase n=1 Tax=Cupriavidus sp. IDO TaxID=1539142 RepID=UPI0005796F9B|nr:NADP-dependent oxidoreductase [Cupriavidus sp. IDO]KWR87859.1 NADP-dependent oxidoreductase [Cupriavidus sp. IDO]
MSVQEPALRWQLKRRPKGAIEPEDLELVAYRPAPLANEQIEVRNIYLSLDPTQRIWMSDREQYLPPIEVGSAMRGTTVGVVTDSRSGRFKAGDLVQLGLAGWETRSVTDARMARPVLTLPGVPLTATLSVLGATGLTAWFGMTRVGQVKAGDMVVVSAAAGAVGSVAGQIAKLRGARVIGIAGGKQKCDWLTGELGFDGAIDYKREDVGAALDRLCPDGIDLDFENVGGAIMEAVYTRMNTFGRMVLCGMISSYEKDGPVPGPADFSRILMRRLRIEGFVVVDHIPKAKEALTELEPWVAGGQIQWRDHVVPGIENALEAMQMLFSGKNDGKLLLGITQEPDERARP